MDSLVTEGSASPSLPLVVGAAQMGQRYGRRRHQPPTPNEVGAILELAEDKGCRGIDTARAYGDSEAAIGLARSTGHGTTLPVITKIAPVRTSAPGEVVRQSITQSSTALRQKRLDTVLLHRAEDLTKDDGGAVVALRGAREAGLIARWGVSVGNTDELQLALTFPDLGYVQLPFNILDRRWLSDDLQSALAARPEVTVAARSAFLQGILQHLDEATWPPGTVPDAATVRGGMSLLAQELRRPSAGICLGYVLAQPWIDEVVVGVRSVDQLSGVMGWCASPLSPDETRRVLDTIPGGTTDLVDPSRWAHPA